MLEADCQACGACCVSAFDDDRFVELEHADIRRLPKKVREQKVLRDQVPGVGTRAALKTRRDRDGNCVCCALRGKVGENVRCTVYEDRPEICRMFVPGSDLCKAARQELGLGTI